MTPRNKSQKSEVRSQKAIAAGLLALLISVLCPLTSEAMALIKRATFSGSSSNAMQILHAGNLGGLDAVGGTLRVVACGPGVYGGLAQHDAQMALLNTGAGNSFMACGWFKVASVYHNAAWVEQATPYQALFMGFTIDPPNGWSRAGVSVDRGGDVYIPSNFGNLVTNVHKGDWNFYALAITVNEAPFYDLRLYLGTNMVLVATNLHVNFGGTASRAYFGSDAAFALGIADGQWVGKWCGASLYSIASDFSDVVFPSDMPSPADRMTYYLNPATGSDTNDGASVFTPWKTGERMNFALTNSWLSPRDLRSPGWLYASNLSSIGALDDTNFCVGIKAGTIVHGGDQILFNTDGAPLYLSNSLALRMFNSHGLKFGSYGTNRARLWFAAPLAGSWAQYNSGTYPNIWQIGGATADAYVWEDWKFLRYATNGSIAGAASFMNSTPGSMFNDGSFLYVHPWGSSNPNTDGKTYYASHKLQGAANGSLDWNSGIYFEGSTNGMIENLELRGLCGVQTNSQTKAIYSIQSAGLGRVVIKGVDSWHGGNHNYGAVHDVFTNFLTCVLGSTFRHSPPPDIYGVSGFTAMVEHCAVTGGDRRAIYWDLDWSHHDVLGSVSGTNIGTFYSHDGGTASNVYSLLWFSNCVGSASASYAPDCIVKDGGWIIEDCRLRQFNPGGSMPTVRRSVVENWFGIAHKGVVMEDCLLTALYTSSQDRNDETITNGPGYSYSFTRCTLDVSRCVNNVGNSYLFKLQPNTILNLTNCIVSLSPTNTQLMLYLPDASAHFSGANNVYYGDPAMAGATNGSVYADPRLDALSRPLADSPSRRAGAGPGRDVTGRLFPDRGTIGAVQSTSTGAFRKGR